MTNERCKPPDHDGELDDWSPCRDAELGFLFIVGTIAGDRKGRFKDGTMMTTSLIRADLSELHEGAVVATLNSRYLLRRRANRPCFDAFLYAVSLGGELLDSDNQSVTSFPITETTGSADMAQRWRI